MPSLWTGEGGGVITDAAGVPILCDNCPCDLPDIRIQGYFDGFFDMSCLTAGKPSAAPPWQGGLNQTGPNNYLWSIPPLLSIGGSVFILATDALSVGQWGLQVQYQNVFTQNRAVWTGVKVGGAVIGVYTKTFGCNPSALTIEIP